MIISTPGRLSISKRLYKFTIVANPVEATFLHYVSEFGQAEDFSVFNSIVLCTLSKPEAEAFIHRLRKEGAKIIIEALTNDNTAIDTSNLRG